MSAGHRVDVGLGDVPVDRVTRLCAANVAPVLHTTAVVLVVRLTVGPDRTIEVILSPDDADGLGADLRSSARYLASLDPAVDTSRWDRR